MRKLVYRMTNPETRETATVKTLAEARNLKANGYTQQEVLLVPLREIEYKPDAKGRLTKAFFPVLSEMKMAGE